MKEKEIIKYLWDIIDDIDTASDIAKSNDVIYRNIVEKLQEKRWLTGITTDGYKINLPKMKKSKNNSISDWLDKHGDPEIRRQVEEEAITIENMNNYKEELGELLYIVNTCPYGWLDKDSTEAEDICKILDNIYKKGFERGVNSSYDDI